jgi:MOSC domain-containing protein YiiM
MAGSQTQQGTIAQINASDGGVPKLPIAEAQVGEHGISVDRQANTELHGHPHQALCLFSLEVIEALQAEGHPIDAGSTGENITVSGLDWASLVPNVRLRLGDEVVIELTGYTTPCQINAQWFSDGDFNAINVKLHPDRSRIYARVLETGTIRTGDPITVLSAVTAQA